MKRVFSIRKDFLAALLFLPALMLVYSCNNDDDQPQVHVAGLMAFNLAPDKPMVGISLSGNNLRSPLPFLSFTGGYVGIYPGTRSTLAFDWNTGNAFTSSVEDYVPDQYYSLFVAGANGNYKNIVVNDPVDSLAGIAGKSYIRYVNAIPDSAKPSVTISNSGGNVIQDSPGFAAVSPFVQTDTGSVTIDINDGGSIQASRTISLEERKVYTVLFAGNPAGQGVNDSIQIRYVENGTLKLDSSRQNLSKAIN